MAKAQARVKIYEAENIEQKVPLKVPTMAFIKARVNNKRSFIDNPYLFLPTRFMYNYTHYQTISVTNFL